MVYFRNADLSKLRPDTEYRRSHKYFFEPAAFDIETTRFQDLAFMYIWQFAIGSELVVFGRTWPEFQEWLRILEGELRLAHDFQLVIFVHDLRYEFGFCRTFLHIDEGSIIARTERKIIAFKAGCFEFRDSYSYTEQPLREMGKAVGIPKGEDFDYSAVRLPVTKLSEDELKYCENDVKILTEYFAQARDEFGGTFSRVPLTLTKRVERYISSEMARSCTRTERYHMAGRQLDAGKEDDYNILKYLRIAYFGGFNYATTEYQGTTLQGVFGADIDTSYISQIMLHRFPMTKFKKMEVGDHWFQDHLMDLIDGTGSFKNRACLIHFKAKYIKAWIPELAFMPIYPKNYLHRAPEARRRMKTEHVAECADIDTVLTDIDFRLLMKHYGVTGLDIQDIYTSRYMPLPEYVIQAAITLAAQKKVMKSEIQKYKDAGQIPPISDVVEYVRVKSMCARIYGVFVKDPIRMQYVFDNNSGRVVPAGLTGIDAAADALDVNGESRKNFSPTLYQWGVWVASWARKSLLDPLYEIATTCPIPQPEGFFNRSVIYSDTDSIYWYDNPEGLQIIQAHNKRIAAAVERFCKKYNVNPDWIRGVGEYRVDWFSHFKVIGLKQYAFIQNGNFQYHISGLPQPDERKKDGEFRSNKGKFFEQFETASEKLEAITEDLSIPAELTGTLKSRYIDEPAGCCVSDEQGNCMHIEIPSCIILEPQGFKASQPGIREVMSLIDPNKLEEVMKRNFYER